MNTKYGIEKTYRRMKQKNANGLILSEKIKPSGIFRYIKII
jgi:hypothetical protein